MLYKILAGITVGLMLGGCMDLDLDMAEIFAEMRFMPGVSVHRIYEANDLTFDEKLLGTWSDESGAKSSFEKGEETNAYLLTVSDSNEQDKFDAYLAKIDGMLFLDISPERPDPNEISFQQMLYVPGHIFFKIEQIEPKLIMKSVDLVKLIEEEPSILKHEVVGESNILVTASTEELQEFLKQHRIDENLFGSPTELEKCF